MLVDYTTPNYFKIVAAGLIDFILVAVFFVSFFRVLFSSSFVDEYSTFFFFLGFLIYRLLTIFISDCTLGMKVFKLVYLNSDQNSLNFKEKALASIFILFQGVDYYQRIYKLHH